MPAKPHRAPTPALTPAQIQRAFDEAADIHQRGELSRAKSIYLQILVVQPQHAPALRLMGVLATQQKEFSRAIDYLDKALAISPDFAQAHAARGVALRELGRLDEALASYDRAIALRPGDSNTQFNRANALWLAGRHAQAIEGYDRVIAIEPGNVDALLARGRAQLASGDGHAALASFDAAVAASPRAAATHAMRGNALLALERFADAVAAYDAALALQPGLAGAWSNRGVALARIKRWNEAQASHQKALAASPNSVDALFNLANLYRTTGRLEEALALCDQVLQWAPGHADIEWNKAVTLLQMGDLARGFALFESRWRTAKTGQTPRALGAPLWLGKEPLAGRTILLHAEAGLGDTIQFARYIPMVEALGARVAVEVPATLLALLRPLAPQAAWMASGSPLPPFDCHCPLLSLALALGTTLEAMPPATAYLSADAGAAAAWASRLGPRDRPRIGLAWSGNARHTADRARSLPLAELVPFLPANADYVCLQNDLRASDRASLQAHPRIRFFGDELRDFADTAALCACMDVVVSVDTSLAHLAGALGKPVWVLLARSPDWRWMLEREDSPWYASMRLLRQGADWEWAPVLRRLDAELSALRA